MKMNPLRFFWIVGGSICLVLGTVGIVLPILPTVPFYMATLFCYGKSSKRMHSWFLRTKLYKKYLESYVEHREMTMKTKCTITGTVTVLMAIGFVMMKRVPIGQGILAIIWLAHMLYFFLCVETVKEQGEINDQN